MKKVITGISLILIIVIGIIEENRKEVPFSIYINEVASSNGSNYQDEDGEYVDWIELYNDGEESISLKGFGLSDKKVLPKRWEFPDVNISPKSYMVICASGKNRVDTEGELHTNFKINSEEENIYLSDANGRFISSIEVKNMDFDKSYGYMKETDAYAIFSVPTPGEENSTDREPATRNAGELKFSYPAGYYDDTIYLEMMSAETDVKIYYTLDGSIPDKTSRLYQNEEIIIADRTSEPNEYTDIWCTPVDFWEGDGNTYNPTPQYKATVLKARLYFPEEDCWSKKIWTNTYLISADYTMPIVSLSLPENLLFDKQSGIYVPGKTFDKYVASAEALPSDKRLWSGNYSKDTKVLGYLEYFDNGVKVMENEVTLRICGAASRGNAQKSMTVYAWGEGNDDLFVYPIFGEEYVNTFSSLRLRAFGNDWRRSMFRDALSQKLVEDLNLGTQAYQPCVLLINGEYFGVYEIRENRDERFFEEHFGIRDKNLVKMELFGLTRENADEYGKEFLDLIHFAIQEDLSFTEKYAYVKSKLDVEQFIDYVLIEQYLYNVDWPENNALVFKSIDTHVDSKYEDGRWRFMLYDLDYAINYPAENNYEKLMSEENYVSILLRGLLENEEFLEKYVERFEELLENCFEPSKALTLQEEFENEFVPEIEETLQRWNVYQADGSLVKEVKEEYWHEKMEDLRKFFVERPGYAREYFYNTINES